MSTESNSLQPDYIRLTERFKALSTFDQFLQGIHRAFAPVRGSHTVDLEPLYNDLKRFSRAGGADAEKPTAAALRVLETKFDAAAAELRAADISLSPSLTRRYFERVRPSDPRIPFYLLRFYASFSQTDEDLLDKVDYLATIVASGTPDPAGSHPKPRAEVRRLFDAVLAGASWPRIDDDTAVQIARAFDELASQIASSSGFEELAEEGWIESLRNFKRQVSRGLAHPEILTSVALCNVTARSAFRRLYEREERILRGASHRIGELEQRSSSRELEDAAALRAFQESRREFDRQVAEGSVRWRQLLEVRQAASEALKMLGLPEPAAEEEISGDTAPGLAAAEDPFWGPCIKRVLSTLEESGAAAQEPRDPSQSKLEAWETDVAKRLVRGESLSAGDRAVISAAALRIKAEEEAESALKLAGARVPSDLLREARETLAHAMELDRAFAGLAGSVQSPGEPGEQVHSWTRTRMRLLHATSALWLALDVPNGASKV